VHAFLRFPQEEFFPICPLFGENGTHGTLAAVTPGTHRLVRAMHPRLLDSVFLLQMWRTQRFSFSPMHPNAFTCSWRNNSSMTATRPAQVILGRSTRKLARMRICMFWEDILGYLFGLHNPKIDA
jgi:hypothetical protein